jgi:uncharacterized peroxidase-related enzyme
LTAYAEKLTRKPAGATEEDVAALRTLGFTDEEIHHACQVVAYFNYANRLASGLGLT